METKSMTRDEILKQVKRAHTVYKMAESRANNTYAQTKEQVLRFNNGSLDTESAIRTLSMAGMFQTKALIAAQDKLNAKLNQIRSQAGVFADLVK